MTKLLLLLSTLVLGLLFLFIPVTEPRDFFPFSNVQLSMDTWFYFIFEKVIVLILAVVILNESENHKLALWTFVAIQAVEVIDYLVGYGEPWSENWPSWNILKVGIFAVVIAIEFVKTKSWVK